MKIDKNRPVYVFDTGALLDFAVPKTPGHEKLLTMLDTDAHYIYHPISLAELADYLHPEIWNQRRPKTKPEKIQKGIRLRRLLISALYVQRKRNDSSTYLHNRRFLPFSTSFEYYSFLAHQRSQPANFYINPHNSQITPVANMTDHQILGVACLLQRSKFAVQFVSGDKMQLAAAKRLCISRIYSKDPETANFPV